MQSTSVKPVGYTWSYLACIIGHWSLFDGHYYDPHVSNATHCIGCSEQHKQPVVSEFVAGQPSRTASIHAGHIVVQEEARVKSNSSHSTWKIMSCIACPTPSTAMFRLPFVGTSTVIFLSSSVPSLYSFRNDSWNRSKIPPLSLDNAVKVITLHRLKSIRALTFPQQSEHGQMHLPLSRPYSQQDSQASNPISCPRQPV
jgi:hypothetical protein